ncbi:MAG: hypothetical protein H7125_11870 [Proteobacteria bacterium]|nr:hypothetical protein [Burkholderiales bacterium]
MVDTDAKLSHVVCVPRPLHAKIESGHGAFAAKLDGCAGDFVRGRARFRISSRARCRQVFDGYRDLIRFAAGVPVALLVAGVIGLYAPAPAAAQTTAETPTRERVIARQVLERANEAGGWWMIVETACDVASASAVLERLNAVLARIRPARTLQKEVSERVQDPHLPEASRQTMENEMRRISELQGLLDELRAVAREAATAREQKQASPERLDRSEWKLAQPVRTEVELAAVVDATERTLVQACTDGIAQLHARFIDETTGILPLAR